MLNHYLTLLRDEKDLFGAQQPCLDTFFFYPAEEKPESNL